jgi:hypothetical protein
MAQRIADRPGKGGSPGNPRERALEPGLHGLDQRPRFFPEQPKCSRSGDSPLPFLDTYRTMCLMPRPEFQRILDSFREIEAGSGIGRGVRK